VRRLGVFKKFGEDTASAFDSNLMKRYSVVFYVIDFLVEDGEQLSLYHLLFFFFLLPLCLLNCLYLNPCIFLAFLSPIPVGEIEQVTGWGQPFASQGQPTMPNSIVFLLNL